MTRVDIEHLCISWQLVHRASYREKQNKTPKTETLGIFKPYLFINLYFFMYSLIYWSLSLLFSVFNLLLSSLFGRKWRTVNYTPESWYCYVRYSIFLFMSIRLTYMAFYQVSSQRKPFSKIIKFDVKTLVTQGRMPRRTPTAAALLYFSQTSSLPSWNIWDVEF